LADAVANHFGVPTLNPRRHKTGPVTGWRINTAVDETKSFSWKDKISRHKS